MINRIHDRQRLLFICLFLASVTLIVFWQVKDHEFTNYDDNLYVTENPHVQAGFTLEGIKWAFTNHHVGHWHPLTWLSFMLDYKLYGLNPSGYHLTNLFLHVINTLLLFLLFTGMTQAVWQSAAVAALFAIHPLHVESVAWVVERKDVLSTLFFISAMISYVSYVKRPKAQLYMMTLLLFILGLMCKPMLVTLPFVLLLLDYWPLKRFKLGSLDEVAQSTELTPEKQTLRKKRSKRQTTEVTSPKNGVGKNGHYLSIPYLVKEKIPFFILSALSSLVSVIAAHRAGAMSDLEVMPLGVRISNAIVSHVIYMWKMVWPQNLAVLYPYAAELPLWEVLFAGLLLLCITGAVIRYMKLAPYLIVGWLWFLGTLVPVIGLLQVGIQAYADRYTYIPLIGLFIILVWGIADLSANWHYRKIVLTSACSMILLFLLVQARIQVGYWQSSITLFDHALRITERNYLAHNNLGIALRGIGKIDEAVSHYQESLRIRPNYEQAHYNLGNALMAQKKMDEALTHYREAIRIKPNYASAHLNIGTAMIFQGRPQEALIHFREALKLDPENAGSYYNMALALVMTGQVDEAINHFQEALQINPGFAEAHNELGRLLAIQGKREEAINHFREALWIKPNFTIAQKNLEMALKAGKGTK